MANQIDARILESIGIAQGVDVQSFLLADLATHKILGTKNIANPELIATSSFEALKAYKTIQGELTGSQASFIQLSSAVDTKSDQEGHAQFAAIYSGKYSLIIGYWPSITVQSTNSFHRH